MDLVGAEADVTGAAVGTGRSPHFPEATPALWGATLDLNLRAAMLAIALIRDEASVGRIVVLRGDG
jgi:hypothetical protein